MSVDEFVGTEVAVVGMAGRFPGAPDLCAYWNNLKSGVESITRYSQEELRDAGVDPERINDPDFVPASGMLEGFDLFDASFFGFNPQDAAIMDPQHRVFLELAWQAIEHAGYDTDRYDGAAGVFAGSGVNTYLMENLMTNPELVRRMGFFHLRHTGNDKDFLATRVSYELDLHGPSVNVQTACSTSLVAVHTAIQSLLSGECDVALAGGVTIDLKQRWGYQYTEGGIASPDGRCRAFDADANGTVFGSGAGLVVLKRYQDAVADGDTIHAVIRGSAVNNDGAQKVGYMAPSVDGQAAVMAEALEISGISPESVSYIETHGTGTSVGDPIEFQALRDVYAAGDRSTTCALGSVKTNIGHLDTAAGVAGLIKTVLALKHQELPPSLHFKRPNPRLQIEDSPFYVQGERADWERQGDHPRRAGISSLGVGGTNAHVVVEEAPAQPSLDSNRDHQLLVLSAKSSTAAVQRAKDLADQLSKEKNQLADVAYTLACGRQAMEYRTGTVVSSTAVAVRTLRQLAREGTIDATAGQEPSVAFLFAGGGAQYVGMGRELYDHEPMYQRAFDTCARTFEEREVDVKGLLWEKNPETTLNQPSQALPALFATQYATASLLMAWGIEPDAMIGHSMGEYTAACIAGVMDVEDAARLVALRGRLFEQLPSGRMVSVPLSESELSEYVNGELSIAAVNAPELCVASGPATAVTSLERTLQDQGIDVQPIQINVAAHSPAVEPILDEFRNALEDINLHTPERRFISNLSGTWITPSEATNPEYWVRHMREPVRFAEGVQQILGESPSVLFEVGPGRTLTTLAQAHPNFAGHHSVTTTIPHPQESVPSTSRLLQAVRDFWIRGGNVDWAAFFQHEDRRRIPLPTYPFGRRRYWVKPGRRATEASSPEIIAGEEVHSKTRLEKKNLDDWFYEPAWEAMPLASDEGNRIGTEERWVILGEQDGLGAVLASQLADAGQDPVLVQPGSAFKRVNGSTFEANFQSLADVEKLVQALSEEDTPPVHIVHALTSRSTVGTSGDVERRIAASHTSLLHFIQAVARQDWTEGLNLWVVSAGLHSVTDGDAVENPFAALTLGACPVIQAEVPSLTCRHVDIATDDEATLEALHAEMMHPSPARIVALRGKDRWVRSFRSVNPSSGDVERRLQENGTYVITGGLGGIGLTIARHLAEKKPISLVLLNRTGLPPRHKWEHLLQTRDAAPKTMTRIQKVLDIEALGADVYVVEADVTDRVKVAEALSEAKEHHGAIRGVIHAAGVLDDAPLLTKTAEDTKAVLAPKVQGTITVLDAVRDEPLDFVLLFSSISAFLGIPGQFDYAAANAFLDAYAEYVRTSGSDLCVTSINWGPWNEVGMTARASDEVSVSGDDVVYQAESVPQLVGENDSFLKRRGEDDSPGIVFETNLDPGRHWFLDEHRLQTGEAVLPGTMYLEFARRAVDKETEDASGFSFADVNLLAPLRMSAGERRKVCVVLTERNGGYAFSVKSCVSDVSEKDWKEHAHGSVNVLSSSERDRVRSHISAPRFDVSRTASVGQTPVQDEHLQLGARWQCLQRVAYEGREGYAVCELGGPYVAEVQDFFLHPSLLDVATGWALGLIDGYNSETDFYVPLSFGEVKVFQPLPRRIYSYVQLKSKSKREVATFNVILMTESGSIVAIIQDYLMRCIDGSDLREATAKDEHGLRHEDGKASNEVAPHLQFAMHPEEGSAAFDGALFSERPRLIVSPVDLQALIDWSEGGGEKEVARKDQNREDESKVAPRDPIEKTLADLWEEMLGVSDIGIQEDFFALGGHSLIAVRLFAKIRKKFGVNLSLSTLFEAPTIKQSAQLIRKEQGIEDPESAGEEGSSTAGEEAISVNGSRDQGSYSHLVPIRDGGDRVPFFCVHGAGGNVLNFNALASRLDDDQPFYGLQARGVDGVREPHERIEDMATAYIKDIQTWVSDGPYLIGGYSGGGVIAFEMARQLTAQRKNVPLLAMIDTFCPAVSEDPRLRYQSGRIDKFRQLWSEGGAFLGEWIKRRWRHEKWRFRRLMIPLYKRFEITLPYRVREIELTDAYHQAASRYELAPWSGTITLFAARNRDPSFQHIDDDLGWEPWADDGVEIHKVPGDHDNLVREPNVDVLAEKLQRSIDEAVESVVA